MTGRHRQGPEPEHDDVVDVGAVRADDLFLDELVRRAAGRSLFAGPDPDATDDAVQILLTTWREDLQPDDLPVVPSVGRADWALRRAQRRRVRPMVAAAAAIAVLLLGSAGIGSRMARPGDPLWGLTQLLWADRVDSANAEHNAQDQLTTAQSALDEGSLSQASSALTEVSGQLPKLQTRDHRSQIQETYDSLVSQVSRRLESEKSSESESTGVVGTTATTPRTSAPVTTTAPTSARTTTAAPSTRTRSSSVTAPPRSTAVVVIGTPATPSTSTNGGPGVATTSVSLPTPTTSAPVTTSPAPSTTDAPTPSVSDTPTASDTPTTSTSDSTTDQPNLDVTSSPISSTPDDSDTSIPVAVPTTLPTDTTTPVDTGLSADSQTTTAPSS